MFLTLIYRKKIEVKKFNNKTSKLAFLNFKKRFKVPFLYCILVLFPLNILAQNDIGTWNVLNFNAKFTDHWSAFAETQVRSISFYNNFHYHEFKIGANYLLLKNFVATAGIGSYATYSEIGNFESPIQNKEIRTWTQFAIKTPLDRVLFENRFRFEQRFTSNGYRNRYRIRIGATIPINHFKIQPKTISFIGWNELFFTNKEPYFERNRIFLGFGYEMNNHFSFQTGYISQFDYKINDETGKDFINISLLYQLDLRKKKQYQQTNLD